MTESCTGLPTQSRESASDTPARLPHYLTCTKARPRYNVPPNELAEDPAEAEDLPARLEAHGAGRGARLMEVIKAAGIGFTLARTWPGTKSARAQVSEAIEVYRSRSESMTLLYSSAVRLVGPIVGATGSRGSKPSGVVRRVHRRSRRSSRHLAAQLILRLTPCRYSGELTFGNSAER